MPRFVSALDVDDGAATAAAGCVAAIIIEEGSELVS